ncbi:phosphatase PAP2 family protein [Wenyingzhuangia sp. 2_MG-2023]|uniref:phosphatase PAP2 family protein n=1 Tax=Wenyingzhuangia sp. 2_MG-2023 TaxID=3062639 RepID=UPI0026E29CCF|nr:phosphatase PAP2 family protein [Wenyingzhuangia sp. 2_MG-2023]MDO6736399.1 phosphatase PAP2 family protein [Wenyingzhuangia sp. 2_MG-2023]
MSFLDTIIAADQELLIYLNNFGSEPYDQFWLIITKPLNWIPLFLFWLFLLIKNYKWQKGLFLFLFICAMAGLSDVLVNIIKYSTARPRPCWQEGVLEQIRILKCSGSFSFVSGHATTSTAVTTFMYLLFRKKYRWSILFYIYPLLFAYSRIYMGKHYPVDILCGYTLGIIEAILYLKLAHYILSKWKGKKKLA